MSVKLKPLHQQVVLITGASSGIGLVTAKHAAKLGAKVILISRNEDALRQAVDQIKADGGEATYATADVADIEQFRAAAEAGIGTFGRVDTWVNNAGVGMFTNITQESDTPDDRKLFETNFWGVVNGSRLAVQYLRDRGGALVNVGSEVSDVTTPTQGMYAASKHAVLGFTDAFRQEIIHADLPISVTLVKPAAIDTPFAKHAKNNTDKATTLPAPVYAPELVADQILHAAEFGGRELYVGGGGRAMVLLSQHFPTLADWFIGKFMPSQELKDGPPDRSNEALHGVGLGGAYEERGGLKGERIVRERSVYGVLSRHPYIVTFVTAAAGAGLAYLLLKGKEPEPTRTERVKRALHGYADGPVSKVRQTAKEYLDAGRRAAADYAGTARDTLTDYAGQARDRAAEYADMARDAVADYGGRARDKAADYADTARGVAADYADTARDAASDYVDTAAGRVRSAHKSARRHADDGIEQAQNALHEHLLKPAERLLETARHKLHEWLGR